MNTPAHSRSPLSLSANELRRLREIQKRNAGELSINVTTKEHEGAEVPYIVEVLLDGDVALQLTRSQFKTTGQMERFCELLRAVHSAQQKTQSAYR